MVSLGKTSSLSLLTATQMVHVSHMRGFTYDTRRNFQMYGHDRWCMKKEALFFHSILLCGPSHPYIWRLHATSCTQQVASCVMALIEGPHLGE